MNSLEGKIRAMMGCRIIVIAVWGRWKGTKRSKSIQVKDSGNETAIRFRKMNMGCRNVEIRWCEGIERMMMRVRVKSLSSRIGRREVGWGCERTTLLPIVFLRVRTTNPFPAPHQSQWRPNPWTIQIPKPAAIVTTEKKASLAGCLRARHQPRSQKSQKLKQM